MYLGSKIFNGKVPKGKTTAPGKGNIGILGKLDLEKLFSLFIKYIKQTTSAIL